jgi:hypothetical protein
MDWWAVECLDCDVFETLKLLSRSGLGPNRVPLAISIQGSPNCNSIIGDSTSAQRNRLSICRRRVAAEAQDFLRVVATQPQSPLQDWLSLLVCCTSYATIECFLLQIALFGPTDRKCRPTKLVGKWISSRDLITPVHFLLRFDVHIFVFRSGCMKVTPCPVFIWRGGRRSEI